jgi:hypothetical protein
VKGEGDPQCRHEGGKDDVQGKELEGEMCVPHKRKKS